MTKKRVFKGFGLKVVITDKVIEVSHGWWPFRRRLVVPFRTLNQVTWNPITSTIKLEAGVGRAIPITFLSKRKAMACYDAILAGGA